MTNSGPLSVVKEGNVTVVIFGSGQRHLSEIGLEAIQTQLVGVAETARPPRLVLDMAATEFFGSSFIEVLFKVWRELNTQPEAKFAISGLQDHCREVLEITNLYKLWPIFVTRSEAVAATSV
jgi:anti-sigma B factor antagonist